MSGRIPSKKNSKQIFRAGRGGRPFITTSNSYKQWQAEKTAELMSQGFISYKVPADCVEVDIVITFPDRIKADLTNKAESILDLLVEVGLLADDNHFNIPKVVLRSGGVDKFGAGAEITIKADNTGFYADLRKNKAL